MQIKADNYKNEGMYLHFENGDFLDLSIDNVKRLADEYWNNPKLLPAYIRDNDFFKTCTVCPYRGQDVFCSAVKPLLPFLEKIENFLSYSKVTAVYVNKEGLIQIKNVQLQKALQYITSMAIFEYCEDAKQYQKYFKGIMPFMEVREIAARLFLNVYWLNNSDMALTKKSIKEMTEAVTITSKSCVQRLRLMCKSDAFINAYVNTQVYSMLLSEVDEVFVERYFLSKP